MMKRVILSILATTLISTFALADTAELAASRQLIAQISTFGQFDGGRLRVNVSKGTAWVQVETSQWHPHFDYKSSSYLDASVPGLRYDAPTAQILFEGASGRTVCANVREKEGYFGSKLLITPTGQCSVTADRAGRVLNIYFQVKN